MREGYRRDTSTMALEGPQAYATAHIPDLDSPIIRRGRHPGRVTRKDYRTYTLTMTPDSLRVRAAGSIPDLDSTIC